MGRPMPLPEAAEHVGLVALPFTLLPNGNAGARAHEPAALHDAGGRLSVGVLSEDSVALAFIEQHGTNARFDHTAKAWFIWDGVRWKRDGTGLAYSWARALSRELAFNEPPNVRKNAGRAAFCRGVEDHASRDQEISI